MKPEVSRARGRNKGQSRCSICKHRAAVEGQRHCRRCHRLTQQAWRLARTSDKTLDEYVRLGNATVRLWRLRLGLAEIAP